jgi:hypothetical protein
MMCVCLESVLTFSKERLVGISGAKEVVETLEQLPRTGLVNVVLDAILIRCGTTFAQGQMHRPDVFVGNLVILAESEDDVPTIAGGVGTVEVNQRVDPGA